jgi:uncharacterized protein YndB with AHSA1/START domain
MAEAELARFIDRLTVEYVRIYAHPIDRVWRAITDPAEFRAWFIPGEIDLKLGGAYKFASGDFAGKLTAIDPPRLIRFSHSSDPAQAYFQYELAEVESGTRMRFIQRFAPGGFVGGWHEHFDALGDFLDGVLTGSRLPPTEMNTVVKAWVDGVRERGMTDKDAARIVLGLRRKERWNELNKIYRAHIRATLPPAEPTEN